MVANRRSDNELRNTGATRPERANRRPEAAPAREEMRHRQLMTLCHDLRNPLTTIGVIAEIMQRRLRRGLDEKERVLLGEGLALTLVLAMAGQAVTILTPIVLQSVIDDEILAPEGPSISGVILKASVALIALVVGVIVARAAVLRLVTTSSNGLSDLRVMTFRHLLHRSVLHVESSRRGVLVARVEEQQEGVVDDPLAAPVVRIDCSRRPSCVRSPAAAYAVAACVRRHAW